MFFLIVLASITYLIMGSSFTAALYLFEILDEVVPDDRELSKVAVVTCLLWVILAVDLYRSTDIFKQITNLDYNVVFVDSDTTTQ